jgi:transposase-like protein
MKETDSVKGIQHKNNRLYLNLDDYYEYFSVWSAIPPAYDTTADKSSLLKGVHVHLKWKSNLVKFLDQTFKEVLIDSPLSFPKEHIKITGNAALAYRASIAFDKPLKSICCPHCHNRHLDTDYFSVKLHKRHLCEVCKKIFSDSEPSISNPIVTVKSILSPSITGSQVVLSKQSLDICQKDFSGIKIWGSAPAILWNSPLSEESGIHIHAFDSANKKIIDNTFNEVKLDGYVLNVKEIQYYTAQNSLQYLSEKLTCLTCPRCNQLHFDQSNNAVRPHEKHCCEHCGFRFLSPMNKKVVSNPFVILKENLMTCYHQSSNA